MDPEKAEDEFEALFERGLNHNLNEVDSHEYALVASAAKRTDSYTREQAITHYLWEESAPYELKRMVADSFRSLETVRLWNWRYMRSHAFRSWIIRESLDEAAFDNLMLNPAFTIRDVNEVFSAKRSLIAQRSTHDTYSFQDGLLKRSLNTNLTSHELLALLPMFDVLKMDKTDLLVRLREAFDIAEDVPDSWVEYMLADRS